MRVLKALIRSIATIFFGGTVRQIRERDRADLPPLEPGELRLFNPGGMPVLTAQVYKNRRLERERTKLSAQE